MIFQRCHPADLFHVAHAILLSVTLPMYIYKTVATRRQCEFTVFIDLKTWQNVGNSQINLI